MLRKILPCIISLGILLLPTIGLGQVYPEVKIGNQVWMTKNLDVSKFRNGDPIPEAKSAEEWKRAVENKQPAWCYYNNDPAIGAKYGKLYNRYAVIDARGLAPRGWHLPNNEDWIVLTKHLGSNEGSKLKSTTGWSRVEVEFVCTNCINWNKEYRSKVPCHVCKDTRLSGKKSTRSGDGSNISGFTGLPGGYRHYEGGFDLIRKCGFWWSTHEITENLVHEIHLMFDFDELAVDYVNNGCGFSVRCLKDK